MKYPTIRIEGPILAAEVLEKLEQGELTGQKPLDFGITDSSKVKDEIARAWADAASYWGIFKRKRESLEGEERQTGTSETRNLWMIPFLGILGYDLEFSRAEEVQGKSYAISHRDQKRDGLPVHIMGFKDSLDKKRQDGGPRMSPHALVQEYLNLTEHLYALVSNGLQLRLLRDSSRLIKLSYLEFDLERMMEEEQYSDFAILYRLLHATRMPVKQEATAESLIETYHQDSLESGSRIREGLSEAVEQTIRRLSNGFLQHPQNVKLRDEVKAGRLEVKEFYQWQLRLIYRLLFLMVIEERDLVYPKNSDKKLKKYYYDYYSLGRLRKLCEKRFLAEPRYSDYWQSILNTFLLFENEKHGGPLGILPLSGELFGYNAVGLLNECKLDNKIVLECLRQLSVFKNKKTDQLMRVNYASLNVEEFGSVYEGLLEYDPVITQRDGRFYFDFEKGQDRSSSGSHYTPDELVQPLIKHSLDYIIQDKLKEDDKESALLSITVCDVACGSGHILLSAARRIATELAIVRTGEDQPSPSAFRLAIRDVIRNCIYGVDLNPLAVELCKVALWLEAHNPNEPLNFLDHHIKCGNAIVGLAHFKELENGIASEAFKALPVDNKDVAREFKKRNDLERKVKNQLTTYDLSHVDDNLKGIRKEFDDFTKMPERTPEEIRAKGDAYTKLTSGSKWFRLKQLADIQIAQLFIPKTIENKERLTTDAKYRSYLNQGTQIFDRGESMAVAQKKRFFHWFLEFPEVFNKGGFDCVLGNPPFLNGLKISEYYGDSLNLYLVTQFRGASKKVDLSAYFFRRNFEVLNPEGFMALISTNTISQGKTREGGLEIILDSGGEIIFAMKSIKWPGAAAVIISLVGIYKGANDLPCYLNSNLVDRISSLLEDEALSVTLQKLASNQRRCYQGSNPYGKRFEVSFDEMKIILDDDPKSASVIQPYIGGKELNSRVNKNSTRWIINFHERSLEEASQFRGAIEHVRQYVKPERDTRNKEKYPRLVNEWWKFWHSRQALYSNLKELGLSRVFARSRVSNIHIVDELEIEWTYSEALIVFLFDSDAYFGVLQSDIHGLWAERYASTMKNDTRYVVSACFETFPFPKDFEHELLKTAAELLIVRARIQEETGLGLTKIYRLFHDSGENTSQLIEKMRGLHQKLNKYTLMSYRWSDIDIEQDFHQLDSLPEKDNIRFTISPLARKEILKRLLILNHELYQQEVAQGRHSRKKAASKPDKKGSRVEEDQTVYRTPKLFEEPNLFNQTQTSNEITKGSSIKLEPEGKDAAWFSIGVAIEGTQKLGEDSALAKKLIGKKAGDFVDFGNGFKVLEVR